MNKTIIYVFGPKRLVPKYYSNEEMRLEEGGWLKIGQTEESDANKNKWDSAVNRVSQESRTGVPEVCRIYDVFEYPKMDGNVDDKIRKILTNDIYTLENSKNHNKNIDQFEIKAGQEFVYGVTRSQLLNAIAKFERNLILEKYNKEGFKDLMELIIKNNQNDEVALEPNTDNNNASAPKDNRRNGIWESVIGGLKQFVKTEIKHPSNRPYIYFNSPSSERFNYSLWYSERYGLASVGIETQEGETGKKEIEDIIIKKNISDTIKNLKMKQGVKNKDKWSWIVSDSLDKTDKELVDWFVKTITQFYNSFEENVCKITLVSH